MTRINISAHRLRAHLRRGGVVAYPTESCYGLGGLPDNRSAIARILKIKKRPQNKGLIVIGRDLAQLSRWLKKLPETDKTQISAQWPAAKTFLLPAAERVLPELRGRRRDKLAVRVPNHETARKLCDLAQSALISTSCNRSGARTCRTFRQVRQQFGRDVLIIRGQIGKRKQPSTIIDWANQLVLR